MCSKSRDCVDEVDEKLSQPLVTSLRWRRSVVAASATARWTVTLHLLIAAAAEAAARRRATDVVVGPTG